MSDNNHDPLGDLTEDETLRPIGPVGRPVAQPGNAVPQAAPPYLRGLNPAQLEAVEALDGPVLVLAGAGTGKTRVLTTRLGHLLATRKAYPGQILAVTFTNKAAREMKERIGKLIGGVVEGMQWLGTFHSIGAQILRRHAELVGLRSNFTILDTDDQIRLLKQLIEAEGIDIKAHPPRLLAGLIDKWKNKGLGPKHVPAGDAFAYADGKGIELYQQYQDRLKILNAADFGDLLLENLRLFQENPDVLKSYQDRFQYMLVDEYQDTNVAQYLWLRLLAQGTKNICCVGDDDQSIYGWRGAEVDNILKFEKDFPGAKVVRLEQNYRSTPQILAAASGLISANESRLGKTLWTEAAAGDVIKVTGVWDGEEEARTVCDEIEALHSRGKSLSEMAILVRTSAQMRQLEERLITVAIPYQVFGGARFFDREESRDANAYLRVIAQRDDSLAFERIINKPSRKIGKTTVQVLHQVSRAENCSLYAAAQSVIDSEELKPAARKAVAGVLAIFERWREQSKDLPPDELAEIVLDESGYTAMWQNDRSPKAPAKLDNLQELVRTVGEHDTLQGYLEHIALVTAIDKNAEGDQASLMTLHSAKGLEFDYVFLPGWEEGLFPSQRTMDESGLVGLEEERRLAYVAITRARKRVWISHVANRFINGHWLSSLPSRFIEELPAEHVEMEAEQGLYSGMDSNSAGGSFEEPNIDNSSYDSPGWQRMQRNKQAQGKNDLGFGQVINDVGKLIATNDPDAARYEVGDQVRHPKFGTGVISEVDGSKLLVEFEQGAKRVISSFVEPA